MSDSCNFRQCLASQGLKLTAVRLAVLEALGDASRALRAQEILTAIRARRPVNKVTIYRILAIEPPRPGAAYPCKAG